MSVVDQALSESIEALLVERNPRQMQHARAALAPGYVLRAASHLRDLRGKALIATGFPVTGTFETDGPVGAISLYRALESLGGEPVLACGPPLSAALAGDFRLLELTAQTPEAAQQEAARQLAALAPDAIVCIERPGLAADGRYYNMRGQDITERCFIFDTFVEAAACPTVGIGDGGNEIGMGNIGPVLAELDIIPAATRCDELVVADVSNWGAYGLIAMLEHWSGKALLEHVAPLEIINYLSTRGSVDGVTGENTLTEDGIAARVGLEVVLRLRELVAAAGG